MAPGDALVAGRWRSVDARTRLTAVGQRAASGWKRRQASIAVATRLRRTTTMTARGEVRGAVAVARGGGRRVGMEWEGRHRG